MARMDFAVRTARNAGRPPRIRGESQMADQDMKSATATYAGFISLAKFGAIGCAMAAALVLVLIS